MKKNVYIIELIFDNKQIQLVETDRKEVARKINEIIPKAYMKNPVCYTDVYGIMVGRCKKITHNVDYNIQSIRYIEYLKQQANIGCIKENNIAIQC